MMVGGLVAAALIGSAQTAQPQAAAEKDPVCGMEVDAKASKALKAQHSGKTYYFCSDKCKKSFEADPGKYAAKK